MSLDDLTLLEVAELLASRTDRLVQTSGVPMELFRDILKTSDRLKKHAREMDEHRRELASLLAAMEAIR